MSQVKSTVDQWIRQNKERLLWGEFFLENSLKEALGISVQSAGDVELGIDFLSIPLHGNNGEDPFGRRQRNVNGQFVYRPPLDNMEGLSYYTLPDPSDFLFDPMWEGAGHNQCRLLLLDGPMQLFSSLLPFEEFIRGIMKHREQFRELFAAYVALLKKLVDQVVSLPIAGVVLGDDVAGTGGPLYGPGILDDLYFPMLQMLVETLSPLPVIVHSDGDLRSLIPSYRETGVAGIQSLERAAGMNPEELVRKYPELLFWGGLSREGLTSDPALLEQEISVLMELRRGGAAVVAGSSTGILDGGMNPDSLRILGQKLRGFMV